MTCVVWTGADAASVVAGCCLRWCAFLGLLVGCMRYSDSSRVDHGEFPRSPQPSGASVVAAIARGDLSVCCATALAHR